MRVMAEIWLGLFNESELRGALQYRGAVYDASTDAFLLGDQAQDELVKRWLKRCPDHPKGGILFSGYAPESDSDESHELY